MEEIEDSDKKSESYDSVFGTLYFRIYDAVTWRYLDPNMLVYFPKRKYQSITALSANFVFSVVSAILR
jgi:hypothetical protein